MSTLVTTIATTFGSSVAGAAIALAADNWRAGSVRRRVGREALEEFQRVLADWSAFEVTTAVGLEERPLERVTDEDVALARRIAYPYRDLLRREDRVLVERNSVVYDPYHEGPIDSRQPHIDQWASDLEGAINRAFRWWRRR